MAAGDFGKDVEREAKVFGEEVAREVFLHAVDDSLDAFVSSKQSVIMAGIGDDDIGVGDFGYLGSVIDGLLECGNALTVFCRDPDDGSV